MPEQSLGEPCTGALVRAYDFDGDAEGWQGWPRDGVATAELTFDPSEGNPAGALRTAFHFPDRPFRSSIDDARIGVTNDPNVRFDCVRAHVKVLSPPEAIDLSGVPVGWLFFVEAVPKCFGQVLRPDKGGWRNEISKLDTWYTLSMPLSKFDHKDSCELDPANIASFGVGIASNLLTAWDMEYIVDHVELYSAD